MKFPPQPEPEVSPSVDTTGRYPRDAALRAAGYEIASRPKTGPNRWKCKATGRILTESEAWGEMRAKR